MALLETIKKYKFLFEELVKRDFKKKYKRTILGMGWSLLSPLLNVLVLMLVFVNFFGRTQEHYIIYIFSGTLVMSFYADTTKGCMLALKQNASIFSKVNIPKYLFLISKACQTAINFALTLAIFVVFCVGDGIQFGWHMLSLVYPIIFLTVFSFGVGMILASLYIFFRDIEYLYSVFLTLLHYVSAIFYPATILGEYSYILHINPVYNYIFYFRSVVIDQTIPSLEIHALCAIYAMIFLLIGWLIYRKCDREFMYYV